MLCPTSLCCSKHYDAMLVCLCVVFVWFSQLLVVTVVLLLFCWGLCVAAVVVVIVV